MLMFCFFFLEFIILFYNFVDPLVYSIGLGDQNLQNITLVWNSLLLSPIAGAFDDKMSRASVVTFSKVVFAFMAHSKAV